MRLVRTFSIVAALFFAPLLHPQDTRHVTEPAIPPPCVTLDAHLAADHGRLAADDESKLDTDRIQQALDHCSIGHSVVLRARGANSAFLSGPTSLRTGVTLVIGKGATLFASRDPTLYARTSGSCGLVNQAPPGCRPLISVDHVTGAGVMGDGVIDGRGGDNLLGQKVTWWQLAEQARSGGHQQVFRVIVAKYSDNFTLYRITLMNSPNFHVIYDHGDGFTVWGLKIDTPRRGARNTDGVDPGDGARNITITHSYIRDGDDNVALKGGDGGITNVSIVHNHFYWGHGMSIGSETFGGVSKIRVEDLSLDGPDNGIRIKSNASRGGLVEDVVYDNVCIRNSPNPLFFDTGYTAAGTLQGDRYPTYKDLTLRNVAISGGGKISFNGYSADHRIGVNLDNVTVNASEPYQYSIRHADFHIGPGPMNLTLLGEDSTVTGKVTAKAPAPDCSGMFVRFPAVTPAPVFR
ncbi:MAG TPA: glycosyl hydrolase family 28 protein [Acidobacteriaceae bacterium]|jgi:polygalacturonase|nr:glycosyl hydrolase family 28 protein [Acidobacteriaceae bacterium]